MALVGFLWVGAHIFLWLLIFTLVSYAFPNSLAGRTLAIVK